MRNSSDAEAHLSSFVRCISSRLRPLGRLFAQPVFSLQADCLSARLDSSGLMREVLGFSDDSVQLLHRARLNPVQCSGRIDSHSCSQHLCTNVRTVCCDWYCCAQVVDSSLESHSCCCLEEQLVEVARVFSRACNIFAVAVDRSAAGVANATPQHGETWLSKQRANTRCQLIDEL